MDGEKINIVYQDGKEEEVDVVTYLNSKDSMNQYLVYTKNEKQSNGDIVIYISKFIEENGQKQLTEISDNDEWKDVQKLLREIANAQVGDYSMNEKFDYKDSLTDIKASLFDIYEDQERVIGSINPDLRDKHVSEFIEIKDLALSLLEKIQKLYDNSLVSVKDNNEKVVSTNVNSVDNMQEHDVNNNEEVNNQDVENNTLEDDQVSSDEEESNQDNNDIDEDNIQTNDEVETPDESSLDDNSDDESVQNNSDIDENNTQTADEVETPDESSLDDSSDDQGRENSDTEESEDSDSEISFDNGEDNSNKYYLLCDEDKLHFAYVSEKLFNKIKSHHVSDTEPLEEDIVSDVDTSDGNIYKKDDLPVKGIIVRNDQYMKLALSKHRQEGVLKEAKNYRIETVKRKRQEQQKIELEKAKVHLDIQEDNYE